MYRRFILLVATMSAGWLLGAPSANALCMASNLPEEGTWANWDSNTRAWTKVVVHKTCQDQIRNGRLYPPNPWTLRLFGSCSPTDCDLGTSPAYESGDWIYTIYRQSYATRYVYVRTYDQWPGWLRVWVHTDFVSSSRTDYTTDDWFYKQ